MRKSLTLVALLAMILAPTAGVLGQDKPAPLPPLKIVVQDFQNDHGGKIRIGWLSSMDDPTPTLPTLVLENDPVYGTRSPQEQLEYDVGRNRFVHEGEDGESIPGWYDHLRLSIAGMLEEKDPVLASTFRLYVSSIVRRHLDNPTILADSLPKPDAWLTGFAARFELAPGVREPVDDLIRRLGDVEKLKNDADSVDDTYLSLLFQLIPALDQMTDPDLLLDRMRQDEKLAELVEELISASELDTDRRAFREIFTTELGIYRAGLLLADAVKNASADIKARAAPGVVRQKLKVYVVERSDSPDGPWIKVGSKGPGTVELEDGGAGLEDDLVNGKEYFYRVIAVGVDGGTSVSDIKSNRPAIQWWHQGRTNNFFATSIFIALILGWIWAAGKRMPPVGIIVFSALAMVLGFCAALGYGTPLNVATMGCLAGPVIAFAVAEVGRKAKELYIRPIAGIQAVEEAIGRATEMGKPILFVPGLSTIEDIATLAALNILGPVAEKAAEYDSKIIVPNRDPIVYTIAQEIVKEAYLRAGRPDSFDPGNIYFVTGRQFAYAAAVNGLMLREKPATNFFLGMFWAESLLLAETGNMTGAIQIAGTDAVTQLPFFIVACDYTLIGEELYAAGAYMGRDPKLLGGLKGQDSNKAIVLVALAVFALLFFACDVASVRTSLTDWIRDVFGSLFMVKN